ncbi:MULTISPECIES: MBL fold metallo-hydrolase [Halocynthiibacter]|uniref:MBL fold metallo-hydrolase n=1 Tax=Halocynthiibacter halioticoli TaxID=2986804 RepID=A0AAE3J050_9RHOB|nr:MULTISPECIES: MBL fold metallo-hydrolase [Halocynthiibacter]MCV6824899.1 MBL fold metallo-hydrolase [Halocynthiibacter halioticoli]MCW4057900.1 MBL fold metallo-hydrolase [Halocynthiibacter sp. SDUM655004]
MSYRFTILGCGSSGGVPRLGGNWGECDPANPKNRRQRCSMLVERIGPNGITRALIDTSPDMRAQLLAADVGTLDGVVFTHQHADHMHGLDDIRQIVFNTRIRMPVWADSDTTEALISRFGYAFVQPKGSDYPPICELNAIGDDPFSVSGAGGEITFLPLPVIHGRIDALGFRIEDLAYIPDVSDMPEQTWDRLQGLELLVLDALRRKPHPSHIHLEKSLEWIAKVAPQNAVLTNMHIDLDYETLRNELPEHIAPAFDGMVLTLES